MGMRSILHESSGTGGMEYWSVGVLERRANEIVGLHNIGSDGFEFEIERRNESRLTLLLILQRQIP
jgi:hypothetical protein